VPIYLARHVHYDCQHHKERDCAHEQRVILLPQSDVKKQINASKSCADHECAHAASKEKAAIPCDQKRRCQRRDQVSPAESDKFQNQQKQKKKKKKRRPDHQILKRMNFLSRCNFKKKERCEDEHQKEHPVFDETFNVTIGTQDRQEFPAEKRI